MPVEHCEFLVALTSGCDAGEMGAVVKRGPAWSRPLRTSKRHFISNFGRRLTMRRACNGGITPKSGCSIQYDFMFRGVRYRPSLKRTPTHFMVGFSSDLLRDYGRLFGMPSRLDRIPMSRFEKHIFIACDNIAELHIVAVDNEAIEHSCDLFLKFETTL